jgi:hypothetical protein
MRQPLQYYRIIAGSHESMTYISPQLLQNLQNNIIIPDHS